jgi:hypothetical protein
VLLTGSPSDEPHVIRVRCSKMGRGRPLVRRRRPTPEQVIRKLAEGEKLHALGRKQDHLGSPPCHHRSRIAPDDPWKVIALLSASRHQYRRPGRATSVRRRSKVSFGGSRGQTGWSRRRLLPRLRRTRRHAHADALAQRPRRRDHRRRCPTLAADGRSNPGHRRGSERRSRLRPAPHPRSQRPPPGHRPPERRELPL